MINVTKKKRGRKPKNKIVINDNPVFENKNKVDNLIACISYKKINVLIKLLLELSSFRTYIFKLCMDTKFFLIYKATSNIRIENAHSLSYHASTLVAKSVFLVCVLS